MKRKFHSIGVRDLIDSVLRSGSLDNSFFAPNRPVEGTRYHQKIQMSVGSEYRSEVPLSHRFLFQDENIELEVKGKADGVFESIEGTVIDEIKIMFGDTRKVSRDTFPNHWHQAKCYAFMWASREKLNQIGVQLTYFFPDRNRTRRFREIFTIEELAGFIEPLVGKYAQRLAFCERWGKRRDDSIRELVFPYPTYNKGQKEYIDRVFGAIRDRKMLFAQAPTGIGKTLASVFPAVKAIGEGYGEKIFYLTSKTSTQMVAESTFDLLSEHGLKAKVTVITAKDKICFKETALCEPYYCEYAEGHFDRVDEAIQALLSEEKINRSLIEETARAFRVCPFELSLDAALLSDIIICDYNYAFDPRVFLKRFFLNAGDYIFLVDEAHNLVDRAREMFSAEILRQDVEALGEAFRAADLEVYQATAEISRRLLDRESEFLKRADAPEAQTALPKQLITDLNGFLKAAEKWLEAHYRSPLSRPLIDLYFIVSAFVKTADFFDEKYRVYDESTPEGFRTKLFCLDPSSLLSEFLKKGRSAIFFSATLLPLDYFVRLFGGDENAEQLIVPSPFPSENLCLLVNHKISTTYRNRGFTHEKVIEMIETLAHSKKGNFLVFFPSHKYLQQVYRFFALKNPGMDCIAQKSHMSESERRDFIAAFSEDRENTLVAFAVMGGIFGEGIDLRGEKLSGAVIVGVGYPQICLEREIIKDYFTHTLGTGYEYAYVYPGMIKVMQAAGRVIRSPEDRGVVLLIDERFGYPSYQSLFPPEWAHARKISSSTLSPLLKAFWKKK